MLERCKQCKKKKEKKLLLYFVSQMLIIRVCTRLRYCCVFKTIDLALTIRPENIWASFAFKQSEYLNLDAKGLDRQKCI